MPENRHLSFFMPKQFLFSGPENKFGNIFVAFLNGVRKKYCSLTIFYTIERLIDSVAAEPIN